MHNLNFRVSSFGVNYRLPVIQLVSLAPLILAEPLTRSVTDKGANQKTHISLTLGYIQVDKEDPHISAHQSPTRIKPVP
jgi:hypothetical protein